VLCLLHLLQGCVRVLGCSSPGEDANADRQRRVPGLLWGS